MTAEGNGEVTVEEDREVEAGGEGGVSARAKGAC
jgi:hypothetical protein